MEIAMADIFVSYKSADRPRAETLKSWFERAGWSVWIDRGIEIGEEFEPRIARELESARLIAVVWSAEARRSDWVLREAEFARRNGKLLQIHGTGLPLLDPYDKIQAVRMQSWSGESSHSERVRLLQAVAAKLGSKLPKGFDATDEYEDIRDYDPDISEALGLAFYYCARQVERVRKVRDGNSRGLADFEEVRESFAAMLALLHNKNVKDDREGVLHSMAEDFLKQLAMLSPDPNALT
jgi:TIR domain